MQHLSKIMYPTFVKILKILFSKCKKWNTPFMFPLQIKKKKKILESIRYATHTTCLIVCHYVQNQTMAMQGFSF